MSRSPRSTASVYRRGPTVRHDRIRRVLGSRVLLVALTGFGQEQDKEKATRAGFDAHLTKPADEQALAGIFTYPVSSGT